jgi:hypothetical protein
VKRSIGVIVCALALSGLYSQPPITSAKDLFKTVYAAQSIDVPFSIECTVSVDKYVGEVSSAFFAFDNSASVVFLTGKSLPKTILRAGERIRVKGRTRRHDYGQVVAFCNSIDRLGKGQPPTPESATMEDILCDEYAKEFAFEGIRFYDLQRIARHKNEAGLYGSDFGSIWFADKLKNNNPQVDLTEPKNWYLSF